MQITYRTIAISDVHLGTKDCKAEELNNFLKNNTCDNLYLVGDIIENYVTGVISLDLEQSIIECLELDRDLIKLKSKQWTWKECWKQFKNQLIKK